jgi:hypothetical protein
MERRPAMEIDKFIWLTTDDSWALIVRKEDVILVCERLRGSFVRVRGIEDPYSVAEKHGDIYARLTAGK